MDCGNPPDIRCNAVVPPIAGADVFDYLVYDRVKLIVPQASVPQYRAAPLWKEFRYINDTDNLGVEAVEISPDEMAEDEQWFDIQGNRVSGEACHSGLYIVKSGDKVEKRIKK